MNIDKQIEQVKSLPMAANEEWIMERKAVNLPIEELDFDESPHILIAVSPGEGIISTEIVPADTTNSETLSWALGCMLSPMEGKPRRPKSILLSGGELEALRPALAQTGVQVRVQSESHPFVATAVSMMEQDFNQGGIPPYLVDTDLDPDMVADLFSATAEFFKLKPWKFFEFEIPMKVTLQLKKRKEYWAVVMGVAGEQLGLSLFRSAADLEALFVAENPDEVISSGQQMRFFGFSFENIDEIGNMAKLEYQACEWTLAAKSAYPSAIVFDSSDEEGARKPDKKELEDLIAVTRTITAFCKAHRKQIKEAAEEVAIIEETFTVPVQGRQIDVHVEFPAPELLDK